MINYTEGYYGVHLLFRIYGSAMMKANVFSGISCIFYVMYYSLLYDDTRTGLLVHPYPVTALISSFTIALSFKLTCSYNRWWEAATALHTMHAKWLDVASTMAAFHLQSKIYDDIAPPAFGDHQDVNYTFVRKRESTDRTNFVTARETLSENEEKPSSQKTNLFDRIRTARRKNKNKASDTIEDGKEENISINVTSTSRLPYPKDYWTRNKSQANGLVSPKDAAVSAQERENLASKPSLFLQETAHLVSLLSAVALSTLRYDADGEEAPLTVFVPGKKWPHNNSDHDGQELRQNGYHRNRIWLTLKYLLDVSRSRKEILDYNSARPFPVIGGISDKEAELLRNARGSSAKVSLVYLWITEMITREHQHGSMGTVAPPIISRLYQFTSDGHLWYNTARKMAYIPFPFPHTQLTTGFIIVAVFVVPLMMLSKTNIYFGFVLNYFVMAVLAGLNEVAKELQNPFTNVPNDLPLNLFQAQFNESLVTIFASFHPDAWWELKENA